jgi:hypothetical protein
MNYIVFLRLWVETRLRVSAYVLRMPVWKFSPWLVFILIAKVHLSVQYNSKTFVNIFFLSLQRELVSRIAP